MSEVVEDKTMDYTGLIIFGGFIAFMYMFIIRPQQQRQKQMRALLESLAAGDDIVTIGGFHGRIERVDDDTVTVKIADGTVVVLDKSAVGRRADDGDASA